MDRAERIRAAQTPILDYLRRGGQVGSDEFADLLVRFFQQAVAGGREIYDIATEYMLEPHDLMLIYLVMARAYPKVCLDIGGPLLIPTLVFMEQELLGPLGGLAMRNERNGLRHDLAVRAASRQVADWIYKQKRDEGNVMDINNIHGYSQPDAEARPRGCYGTIQEQGCGCLAIILAIAIAVAVAKAVFG